MTKLTEFQKAEIDRLNAELADAYAGGYAAGRVVALELAAGVCDARAAMRDLEAKKSGKWEEMGDTVYGELADESRENAAAIRALAHQPPPTGGHGAESE